MARPSPCFDPPGFQPIGIRESVASIHAEIASEVAEAEGPSRQAYPAFPPVTSITRPRTVLGSAGWADQTSPSRQEAELLASSSTTPSSLVLVTASKLRRGMVPGSAAGGTSPTPGDRIRRVSQTLGKLSTRAPDRAPHRRPDPERLHSTPMRGVETLADR